MHKTIITIVLILVNLCVGLVTPNNPTLPVVLAIAVLSAGVAAAVMRSRRHA